MLSLSCTGRRGAADVEFILGGAPCLAQEPPPKRATLKEMDEGSSTFLDPVQLQSAATHIWLLDFNQCQSISMDLKGVEQAVKRFFDNDPYYPLPLAATGSTDERLWKLFARRYLETNDQNCWNLPHRFIDGVVEAMHIRREREAEAARRPETYSEYEAPTEKGISETPEQS